MSYVKTMEEYDCDIGILEYAIESANFEISMGNEEYLPIHEALIKQKEKTFGDKVKSFIDKTIKLFKELLDKVKRTFKKVQAFFTRKTIDKQINDSNKNVKKVATTAAITVSASAVAVFTLIHLGKIANIANKVDELIEAHYADKYSDPIFKDFPEFGPTKEELRREKYYTKALGTFSVYAHVNSSSEGHKYFKIRPEDLKNFGGWLKQDILACINLLKNSKYTGEKFSKFSKVISDRLKLDSQGAKEFNYLADGLTSISIEFA